MTQIQLNHETSFYKAFQNGAILQIHFKEFQVNWINQIEALYDFVSFLDLVEIHEDVQVILLFHKSGSTFENIHFFKIADAFKQNKISIDILQKYFEVLDKYILHIVKSKKFFIDVHSGNMNLDSFMISFACDYRILADNTIIKNLFLHIGTLPKGTCVFLMRKIFNSTAYSMLLTNKHHKAYDLLNSGLVNRVIDYEKFENKVLEAARDFAIKPKASISEIKYIANSNLNQLHDSLQIENNEILRKVSKWQN